MPKAPTWPLLLVILLSSCLVGCLGWHRHFEDVVHPPCLTGPVPRGRLAYADETYRLMRRELDRANRATPAMRAHLLGLLPTLFPHDGREYPAPQCEIEYIESASAEILDQKPVVYSRLLLARVNAIDTFGLPSVVEPHVSFLRKLLELPASELTEYRLMPGEMGPPPPKSHLRYSVLSKLVSSRGTWPLVLDLLKTSRDDHELVLLYNASEVVLSRPNPSQNDEGQALVRAWLPELRARLSGPATPISLEIALQRIALLVFFGRHPSLGRPIRDLLQDVLRANGEMPITRGIDGAAQDLAAVSYETLTWADQACRPGGCLSAADLFPLRESVHPKVWKRQFLPELPAVEFPEAERRTRVQDLEAELAQLKSWKLRCHVLKELAKHAVPENAERLFKRVTEPIFMDGKIVSSWETYCRIEAAASFALVSEELRVALLLRIFKATREDIVDPPRASGDRWAEPDMAGPPHMVGHTAALVLWDNLEWIDRHRSLRDWLATVSKENHGVPASNKRWQIVPNPSLGRLLMFHLSKDPAAEPEVGRSILRAWIETMRAKKGNPEGGSPYWDHGGQLMTLGIFAAQYGMRDEVLAFFDEVEPIRQPAPEGSIITTFSSGYPEPLGLASYLMRRNSGPAREPSSDR